MILPVLLLLAGCSKPPVPPPPVRCPVSGVVVDADAAPLAGVEVDGLAQIPVDERRSRTVGRASATTDPSGAYTLELPCEGQLGLEVRGWVALNPLGEVRVEEAPSPLRLIVRPKLRARLRVVDDAGSPVAARFQSARGGPPRVIPPEGLDVRGLESASAAGQILVEGAAPRPWTLDRSDRLERDHDGRFEATVILGATAARWLLLGRDHSAVRGAWCVQGGQRAVACILEPSAIRCPCAGPVAVAGPWDVAVVLPLVGAETRVELPAPERRCLPGDRARPAGVDGGLVLEAPYRSGACVQVVPGQRLEVRVDGRWVPESG